MPREPKTGQKRVRLQPRDAFDLIRLLARSQSDPRKAVAELVQNSLDAGAQTIEITWFNEKGRRALRIWDDGGGVFPELEREEALRRIAHTIGHSHKRDLTPAQRREQLVLGQYGIGLIGFWCVGEILEMKSRVGGGATLVLRLREEKSQAEIVTSRSRRVGEDETFTQVTVRHLHESSINRVRPPRLQAYLATELRGQLLERGATVRIHDRVARGRARKEFTVKPRPFLGQPLEEWRELAVPGFEGARLELYLVTPEEGRAGVVSLSCGGTTVLDDIAEIDGAELRREPWCSGRLEGVVDFPDLHVAPGSRRGFAHDEPVTAFLDALKGLERAVCSRLEAESRKRNEQRHENLTREIRKAFRSVAQGLPDYEFFGIRRPDGASREESGSSSPERSELTTPANGVDVGEAIQGRTGDGDLADEHGGDDAMPAVEEPVQLFPPGPLARLEVRPKVIRIPPLASRTLRVRALDGDGRPCAGPVAVTWQLTGDGELVPDHMRATYTAPDAEPGIATSIRVHVLAVQGDTRIEAEVPVRLAGTAGAANRVEGIPEPHPITAPGESWRSRIRDGRWEYNEAHRDYVAVAGVEARRLRYLIHLFGKEIVLRNFGKPGDTEVLERLVEVLTWVDSGGRRPPAAS